MSELFIGRLFDQGLIVHKRMSLLTGDFVVVRSETKSIFSLIESLKEMPEVEYAEPNYTNRLPSQTDHSASSQSPWEKFGAKEAAIEVIDSQIDFKFPQIKPEIKVNRKSVPTRRNGEFVDDVTLKDLLFISNKLSVSLAEAVEAIDYATKMDVKVLSNSWVKDGFSKALDEALHVADKRGISFVAAASIAASIGSSLGAHAGHNTAPRFDAPQTTQIEVKPVVHVSAGVLSLYIAQEGTVGKTGRGRLIAKAVPTAEEIQHEWSSNSPQPTGSESTAHSDFKITQNYSFPGAKFIKLEIEKLDPTSNLNLIVLRNANGILINNISRCGKDFETDYIETDLITVEFTSNLTSTSVGSVIRNVKVIY